MKKLSKFLISLSLVPCFLSSCGVEAEESSSSGNSLVTSIDSVETFKQFLFDEKDGNYNITKDINFIGEVLDTSNVPSGYKKVLNGSNHKIYNFGIKGSENTALFPKAVGCTFKNLVIDQAEVNGKNPATLVSEAINCKFDYIKVGEHVRIGNLETPSANDYSGSIVSRFKDDSFISNSESSAIVVGNSYVGGFVGYSYNSTLTYCNFTGRVNGLNPEGYIGGIVGLFETKTTNDYDSANSITGCKVDGSVDSYMSKDVGGVIGRIIRTNESTSRSMNDISIGSCDFHGFLCGKYNVGGIVGSISDPEGETAIKYCKVQAEIRGVQYVGGICGNNETNEPFYACETHNDAQNSNCWIYGESIVGGISGNGTKATECVVDMPFKMVGMNDQNAYITDPEQKYGFGGIFGVSSINEAVEIVGCNGFMFLDTISNDLPEGNHVGGIVGLCYGGTINNCSYGGLLGGKMNSGGLCGTLIPKFNTTISNITIDNIRVTTSMTYGGGLIGKIEGSAAYHKPVSISNIDITNLEGENSGQYYGGLIGYASVGTNIPDDSYVNVENINITGIIYKTINTEPVIGYNEVYSTRPYVELGMNVNSNVEIRNY